MLKVLRDRTDHLFPQFNTAIPDSPLPEDPDRLIGPVYMKYTPRNPANSIIVCEQWSGLRAGTTR